MVYNRFKHGHYVGSGLNCNFVYDKWAIGTLVATLESIELENNKIQTMKLLKSKDIFLFPIDCLPLSSFFRTIFLFEILSISTFIGSVHKLNFRNIGWTKAMKSKSTKLSSYFYHVRRTNGSPIDIFPLVHHLDCISLFIWLSLMKFPSN